MRIKIFFKIIIFVLLCVLCGLFYTQIIRGNFYKSLSRKNRIRLISRESSRGNILDRKGRILADSSLSFDVSIIPEELIDKDKVFTILAKLLNRDRAKLERKYRLGFTAPFAPVVIQDRIAKKTALILEDNKYNLSGVFVQAKPRRRYPFKKVLSHVIGYVREVDGSRIRRLKDYGYKIKDTVGYGGVEESQDMVLRAEKGGMQVEVDSKGRMVRLLGLRPSKKGRDVGLSIDLDMQRIAYDVLGNIKGCIVVMNPSNGAILAMVSSPSYDANIFVSNDSRRIARLLNSKSAPFLNRAIAGLYPPASLFKLVTALAALESGKISSSTAFSCNGKMRVGNRFFRCWDSHGRVDLSGAIAESCDIYFYNTGILSGPDKISNYAAKFALGKLTGIDIGGEASGFVPRRVGWKRWNRKKRWFKGDTANLSIGQGDLLVTPLQMARLISVFANGGYLLRPYLIEKVDNKPFVKRHPPKKIQVKSKYLEFLKQGLVKTVKSQNGTAHMLDMAELSVAGKTGTAQVSNRLPHGWFIGFAPVDEPKIAFCVFTEHSGGSHVACSVTKKMLKRFLEEGLIW